MTKQDAVETGTFNATTIAAMRQARAGKLPRARNAKTLKHVLDADDGT